ncbi:MAG: hypothetical protein VW879_11695 [Opitutae bacterium]
MRIPRRFFNTRRNTALRRRSSPSRIKTNDPPEPPIVKPKSPAQAARMVARGGEGGDPADSEDDLIKQLNNWKNNKWKKAMDLTAGEMEINREDSSTEVYNYMTSKVQKARLALAERVIEELYSGTIPKKSKARRDLSNIEGMKRIVKSGEGGAQRTARVFRNSVGKVLNNNKNKK